MNPLLSLLKSDKPEKPDAPQKAATPPSTTPHLDRIAPPAAMPGGEVEVHGSNLGPTSPALPRATIGDIDSPIVLSRPSRATLRVPEGTIAGDVVIYRDGDSSNPLPLRVAVPMAENLHPVSNPAVDATGQVFATVSGSRGQQVPVSIFCIQRDLQIRPFVRELLNPTGLAFGPDGFLYCSSRAEGTIYRISPAGTVATYAEGLGIATGIAFDSQGNLFVGDRTGTIFKIAPPKNTSATTPLFSGAPEEAPDLDRAPSIFVHATLEPSMAAYHLAFNGAGTLFVTGPTTSSNQCIHAIDPDGTTRIFYQGLGRAQGMAFDVDDNLYVAASLHGRRGIVRITPGNPEKSLAPEASLILSGQNLVGLAFLEDGCAALATREALYHVDLGIEGRPLI
ncbi:gluconolaconase [Granulicella sp. dw_53]|uniref:Vgb family protein n=1 Tax=Granulicella sp. dw_53 TaxID=2719792 RepID=UPI001BD59EBB|nr:gluconolaconase [Granulicella sp. dw_53]